jgi:diguanylate cyclase (GGDEF)-like protein
MSLFRQLWLAVVSLALLIALGGLAVNLYSARAYLEKQLSIKDMDNAASLALSISQIPDKNPIELELLVAAQFDTGHYQEIQLTAPDGRVIVERQKSVEDASVPAWFVRLVPLQTAPGIAQVQDGWRQLGTLRVVSHTRFAYRDLWAGALKLLGWTLTAAIVAGLLGSLLLQMIVRPLNQVAAQAQALSERKFTTLAEPRTPELRGVVRAMNGMVERLKQMFAEEARRLDAMRRSINHDSLTGLPNRDLFMSQLQTALTSEESASTGVIALVRLTDLATMNRELGHAGADRVLKEMAAALQEFAADRRGCIAARLKGADFAVLTPGTGGAASIAADIADGLSGKAKQHFPALTDVFHIGAARYRRGDGIGTLLSAADQALATAEKARANAWHAIEHEEAPLALSSDGWRKLLGDALAEQRLKLVFFPVVSATARPMHRESVARLQQSPEDAALLPAADFMPMAARLKLAASVDLEVTRTALAALKTSSGDIALNFSADSISDWGFRNSLTQLLREHRDLCGRLWMEVPEYGVFHQPEAFRDLARVLKELGCRVGIEHAGYRLNELPGLADLGLDYLKVDSNFIRGIDQNPGNQDFLRGLCTMAHAFGISVIAENVQTAAELALLPTLGLDGATGPAVSNPDKD